MQMRLIWLQVQKHIKSYLSKSVESIASFFWKAQESENPWSSFSKEESLILLSVYSGIYKIP